MVPHWVQQQKLLFSSDYLSNLIYNFQGYHPQLIVHYEIIVNVSILVVSLVSNQHNQIYENHD